MAIMAPRPLRKKRCRTCRARFVPLSSLQTACGPRCALAQAPQILARQRKREARAAAQEKRVGLERLMTRSDWLKRAQQAFNAWVRLRDASKPCISCGTTGTNSIRYSGGGQWHAGHYRTIAAAPELRFEPLNVHKQCSQCNAMNSGNIVEYRMNLVQRIGADKVAWLEGPHEPKKYTVEEIKALIARYRGLVKLEQARRAA